MNKWYMDSKYDMINLTQYIVFLTNFKSLEDPVTLAYGLGGLWLIGFTMFYWLKITESSINIEICQKICSIVNYVIVLQYL